MTHKCTPAPIASRIITDGQGNFGYQLRPSAHDFSPLCNVYRTRGADAFELLLSSASLAQVRQYGFTADDFAQVTKQPSPAPADDVRETSDSLTEERLRDLLRQAEQFIAGFEDDEAQEGIPELLAAIRAEID